MRLMMRTVMGWGRVESLDTNRDGLAFRAETLEAVFVFGKSWSSRLSRYRNVDTRDFRKTHGNFLSVSLETPETAIRAFDSFENV